MGAWKKPKRNQGCPARTAQKAPKRVKQRLVGVFSVTPGQVNLFIAHARLHKESPVAGFSCAFLNNFELLKLGFTRSGKEIPAAPVIKMEIRSPPWELRSENS